MLVNTSLKKTIVFLPTRHLRVHMNSFKRVRAFQIEIGIWKCWFLRRGENRSTRSKTSRSKGENQQQTQPTYGVFLTAFRPMFTVHTRGWDTPL